jgi:predicted  nucleic acid-binding Zn-ribbon protein
MTVTARLVRLFLVDKQLRGLTGRLRAAQAFLGEQVKSLEQLDGKRVTLEAQLKTLQAQAMERESEVKRLDARVASLSEQMNSSQNHKQYKAFLAEVNTLKTEKSAAESAALEAMTKADELRKQLSELATQHGEREKVKGLAHTEADQRHAEIHDKVESLKSERVTLAKDVPAEVLITYERLVALRGDEAMGPVEEVDRKRHEYHCGSCMMSLPVELVSGLLSHGNLTKCASCGCILYVEEDVRKSMAEAKDGKKAGKKAAKAQG